MACDKRAREGIFASVNSTGSGAPTTSSGITREAPCHCSGRRYSDLNPTRVCLEALLCHRCTKKFANGCKSSKRVPHALRSRFRRSNCAGRTRSGLGKTSTPMNGRGWKLLITSEQLLQIAGKGEYNPTNGCRV